MPLNFFPREISLLTRRDKKYRAEILFYDSLKVEALKKNESIYVYWNVEYLHEVSIRPGECDFIIILPNHGIAFIEIKGGGIKFSPEKKEWTSTNQFETFIIKDPFQQAMIAEREMIKKIKKQLPETFLPSQHFVGFVDISKSNLSSQKLPPNTISEIILTYDDIQEVGILKKIKNLFNKKKQNNSNDYFMVDSESKVIKNIIRPNFELKPKLSDQINQETKEILYLSDEQIQALKILKNKKKVFIEGGAGTGKTFLAIHKAKELAENGVNTLFLSHSRTLTRSIYKEYFGSKKKDNITISSPFLLTKKLAIRNNVDYQFELKKYIDQNEKFNTGYPALLLKILTLQSNEKLFDAIIVDEGQRFNDDWWLVIEELIPRDGVLYAFYDPNQNLFSSKTSDYLTEQEDCFPLSINFRNTKEIFKISEKLYKGMEIEGNGPSGRPIEWIKCIGYENQNLKIALSIERFLNQGVSPKDIGIINFGPVAIKGGLQDTLKRRGIKIILEGLMSKEEKFISYDSVARFQGHEVPIIILTNFTNSLDENSIPDLYTALTRASNHLVIIASDNIIKDIKKFTKIEN